jgi:hypothetical protein
MVLTAEAAHREAQQPRGQRTVLRAAGDKVPPGEPKCRRQSSDLNFEANLHDLCGRHAEVGGWKIGIEVHRRE